MVFDARNPAAVYLSTDLQAGFFRSRDSGWTWTRVRANAFPSSNLGTTLLVADPLHGDQLLALDDRADIAVTLDGGIRWMHVGALPLSAFPQALLIDPNNHLHLLVASSLVTADPNAPLQEDVYSSGDGGLHWHRLPASMHGISTDALSVFVADTLP